MTDDRWLDEILDKTERDDIFEKVRRALRFLDNMEVGEAYKVLKQLHDELDEFDTERNVKEVESQFEENLKDSVHSVLAELGDPRDPSYLPPEMRTSHVQGHSHDWQGNSYTTTIDPVEAIRREIRDLREHIDVLRHENEMMIRGLQGLPAERPLNAAERHRNIIGGETREAREHIIRRILGERNSER